MPKVHMKSSAGSKTYDSIEEYEADQDGDWYPVEEPTGTELTIDLLEKAGKEGVKMANDCFDEGHTLTLVKEGGRRRRNRKTRRGKKVRSSRKSRR
jgi:hypothetical protein